MTVEALPPVLPLQGAAANTYTLLTGAADFMAAFEADVATCQQSLYAQFMTYEGDVTGKAFSAHLIDRATAGVDVRLVVDAYSDHILSDVRPFDLGLRRLYRAEKAETRQLFERMQSAGVAIKRTNPFGPLWLYFFYRDHKKIIIVDKQVAYLGGINISDHNFAWHDFMVRIEGPVVQQIMADFVATWRGESLAFTPPDHDGDYVLNQTIDRQAVYEQILTCIDHSEHSIVIESPYLVGPRIEAALLRAAERGVSITLILPQHVNISFFRWWLSESLRVLDHPNIRVYGFQGHGGMTHAKLYLFDDRWASFGSLNVSELECMTHREINVFSRDPGLIAQLKQLAERDLASSLPLKPEVSRRWRPPYRWVHALYFHWTNYLLKNPDWRRRYC